MDIIIKMMPSVLDGKAYSSATQTNTWIVIHNTDGATVSDRISYFNKEDSALSAHYVIGDEELYQLLQNDQKAFHIKGSGSGKWTDNAINTSDCSDNNSIGIEISDADSVNFNKAIDNAIELIRFLMKEYSIDADHVIRHGDVKNVNCPSKIMAETIEGKSAWSYIKTQIVERTGNINFDTSQLDTSTENSDSNSDNSIYENSGVDVLPNVDHRYNIANMEEVTGACIIFVPPYNCCFLDQKDEHFKNWGCDREYHYIIDPSYDVDVNSADDEPDLSNAKPADKIENDSSPEEDNSIIIKGGFEKVGNRLLQKYGMADNDTITYINRSLFNSKATRHTIMIACFIPDYVTLIEKNISYEKIEKNIINSISKILWANGLEAKDLWREFDLNRAPSPMLYLDRDKWKKFLTQVDRQVEWRNAKFGKVKTNYVKYIPTITTPNFVANVTISGSDNNPNIEGIRDTEQAVWTFLTGKGYTPECAAGILGNMYQESGVDPTRIQGNGKGPAAGICQWENYNTKSARWKAMSDYASSKGKQWTDLQSQLEWLDLELQGKDSTTSSLLMKKVGGYENFKKLTSVSQACTVFEESFERAGKPNMPVRLKKAEEYYKKFSNSATPATASLIQPRDNVPDNSGGGGSNSSSGSTNLSWPTPGQTRVSSNFGPRKAPCKGASTYHKGIDIAAPKGSDVVAPANGKVTFAAYSGSAGNLMVLDHGNGWGSRYMHLDKFVAKVGDTVSANQVIAKVGNTGIGTGAHLHFEIHTDFPAGGKKGTAQDPLKYVQKGVRVDNPVIGSQISGGTTGGSGGDSTETSIIVDIDKVVGSTVGYITNPGPSASLPYNGNSMGGLQHDEWGGKTSYYIDKPTNTNAKKPTIENIISNYEYNKICDEYFIGDLYLEDGSISRVPNFRNYFSLIDLYVGEQEPYDKGVVEIKDATITPNDRLSSLNVSFTTNNENIFHFNVIESGPGTVGHCAKAADELNYIVTPTDLKVEPIYPDLVIPPQYTTTANDIASENSVPFTIINSTGDISDSFTKQISFDYELLKDKVKKTDERLGPVNFMDPYPTDDKIEELESHEPKVLIDEIESQIYSCNHPGCPIAQPMAKNFAMISDALMNQSGRVEKRLTKLENILSVIMRNQARLGSRMHINCVYYGGQSTFGKYKCIRCMHDDRVNDGAIVTLDQCLNCTRYEPILGQIYQILDDSGYNGSIILDDMQMSYSNLNDFKKINKQTERSPKYNFVEASEDKNCYKPEKTRVELWKEANKQAYLKQASEEEKIELNKSTDEIDNEVEEALESKYIFRMNWNESYFNSQQPDIKPYPIEGIIKRYKQETGDLSYAEEIKALDPEQDKDAIEDLQRQLILANGQWVNTLEKSNAVQVNKYSSENFYFDKFAEIKLSNNNGSLGDSTLLANCRQKIVEMAEIIYNEYENGKAIYNQIPRTVDHNKPQKVNGKIAYDCTSLVSCCYLNAGLKSMYSKSCSGGSLISEIVNNKGEMWLLNDEGLAKAKPGDVIVRATRKISQSDMNTQIPTEHAMIYIGNNQYIHAAGKSSGIKKETLKDSWRWKDGQHCFVRPRDLIEADKTAASEGSSGKIVEGAGVINNKSYVAKIPRAVCSGYAGSRTNASGLGLTVNATCASHNIPYGTKVYIPALQEKGLGDGVLTVTDTGGPVFDFDIYTNHPDNIGRTNMDVYVLSWGNDKIAQSYTAAIDASVKNGSWSKSKELWNKYKSMGGALVTFLKFQNIDKDISKHPKYNDK